MFLSLSQSGHPLYSRVWQAKHAPAVLDTAFSLDSISNKAGTWANAWLSREPVQGHPTVDKGRYSDDVLQRTERHVKVN